MKSSLLFAFATLVAIGSNASACIDDVADMNFRLSNAEQVQAFLASPNDDVKELKAEKGNEHKLAGVTLKDPKCIANAIHSYQSAQNTVVQVSAFVSGRSNNGVFESHGDKKLSLMIDVAAKHEGLEEFVISTKHAILSVISDGVRLPTKTEFLSCDIE